MEYVLTFLDHLLSPQKYDKPKFCLCLAFATNGDVISGDSNGNIYVWGKGKDITLSFEIKFLSPQLPCYTVAKYDNISMKYIICSKTNK